MKKNSWYLAAILFLSLISCSKEEGITSQKDIHEISFLHKNFDLSKSKNSNISSNLKSDFVEITTLVIEDKKIYEYKIEEINKTKLESDFVKSEISYSLLVTNTKNNFKGYLLENYTFSKNIVEYPLSLLNATSFSGYSNIYDIKGEYIGQIGFYNGLATSTDKSSVLDELVYFLNHKANSNSTTNKIIPCNHVVTIRTETYEDIYYQWEDGAGNVIDITFGYSRYLGTTVTYQNIPYPCDSPEGDEKQIVHRERIYTPMNINQIVVEGPNVAITDMEGYLSCFNTSQSAVITIYADQPNRGSHAIFTTANGVGHAFISIRQGVKVKTFGFYPISSAGSVLPNNLTPNPTDFFSTTGIFGNDEGHDYDVSLSIPINANSLTNLINSFVSIANNNPIYNIGTNNCTDIAIMAFESQTGIDIPSCESPTSWSGQTPGTLGVVLSNMTTPNGATKNTNGGSAPYNNCN